MPDRREPEQEPPASASRLVVELVLAGAGVFLSYLLILAPPLVLLLVKMLFVEPYLGETANLVVSVALTAVVVAWVVLVLLGDRLLPRWTKGAMPRMGKVIRRLRGIG